MEKILIIRLSSIGDILQCSAVSRVLKKRFPQAQIHWLVRSDCLELVGYNPHLSHVISYDRRTGFKGFRELTQKLKEQNYTHIYDAHSNLRSHYFNARVRAPHFIRRHKPRMKRFALFWLRLTLFKDYNAVHSFIEPLKAWGVEDDGQGSELHLPVATLQKVRSLLHDFAQKNSKSDASFIALAPSAAWPKKRWPLEYWLELTHKILEQTSDNVVVLGGPADDFCTQLEALNPKRILNLQGKVSLLESAAASSLSKTLIANDTGLLHMAEALGKNVIALIGPTPFGYPTRKRSVTLETHLWCKPCSKDGRGPCVNRVYQKCMKEISPQSVFDALSKFQ